MKALHERLGIPAHLFGPLVLLLLAAVLFGALGLIIPLDSQPGAAQRGLPAEGAVTDLVPPGELDGFLGMRRWGTPVRTPEDDAAEAARLAAEAARLAGEAAMNPELAKLGVIGITSTASSRAVLLTRPDGATVRLVDGDVLPDGRVLVSVAGNSLVLESTDGLREELVLFPGLDDTVSTVGLPPQGDAAR